MIFVRYPCYSILRKYLKNLYIKYCIPTSIKIILSITKVWFQAALFYIIHVSINIIEKIRKALDDGNISCGIFVDLQKACDTVDQQILLAKLNHYGIFRVPNNCIKSYISNCNQF